MNMAGTALDSLQALDLSSFLLNGYQVFSPGEQTSENEAVRPALPPPPPKADVKHSWHVEKASLHIDIELSFHNLSLETGLRPSHKLVCTSQQKATHTHTHTCTHTHAHAHTYASTHTLVLFMLFKRQRVGSPPLVQDTSPLKGIQTSLSFVILQF